MSTHAELLREAIGSLRIHGVNLRSVDAKLAERLRSEELDDRPIDLQGERRVTRLWHLQSDPGAGPTRYLKVFRYAVRVNAHPVMENSDTTDAPAVEPSVPLFSIGAEYDVEYESASEVSQEALDAFARDNVGFNVWPYWRELVQSTAARMGLPHRALVMPPYVIGQSSKQAGSED